MAGTGKDTGKDLEVEKPWKKAERLMTHEMNRGSKYPPFAIQHMPTERERLSGAGMTNEDRRLRHQWLLDQELSPNEPRNIPEVKPKNLIKRIYGKPWDVFFNAIRPVVGSSVSEVGRFYVPKALFIMTGIWAFYYHIKYNKKSWELSGGWDVNGNKDTRLTLEKLPLRDDYVDRGFNSRQAMKDFTKS